MHKIRVLFAVLSSINRTWLFDSLFFFYCTGKVHQSTWNRNIFPGTMLGKWFLNRIGIDRGINCSGNIFKVLSQDKWRGFFKTRLCLCILTSINFLESSRNFSVVANKNTDGLLSSPKEYRTCQHLAKEGPRDKPLCRGGNNAQKNKQRGSATNRPGGRSQSVTATRIWRGVRRQQIDLTLILLLGIKRTNRFA